MIVKALVVGVVEETWFKGTKDERKVKQLNLMDTDKFCQMKESFDYTPKEEELAVLDLEHLELSVITVGVSMFTKENGRLKVTRGKIDLDTVPATARRGSGSADAKRSQAASPERDNGKTVLSGMSAASKAGA